MVAGRERGYSAAIDALGLLQERIRDLPVIDPDDRLRRAVPHDGIGYRLANVSPHSLGAGWALMSGGRTAAQQCRHQNEIAHRQSPSAAAVQLIPPIPWKANMSTTVTQRVSGSPSSSSTARVIGSPSSNSTARVSGSPSEATIARVSGSPSESTADYVTSLLLLSGDEAGGQVLLSGGADGERLSGEPVMRTTGTTITQRVTGV